MKRVMAVSLIIVILASGTVLASDRNYMVGKIYYMILEKFGGNPLGIFNEEAKQFITAMVTLTDDQIDDLYYKLANGELGLTSLKDYLYNAVMPKFVGGASWVLTWTSGYYKWLYKEK